MTVDRASDLWSLSLKISLLKQEVTSAVQKQKPLSIRIHIDLQIAGNRF